jgi:hypothetical protein
MGKEFPSMALVQALESLGITQEAFPDVFMGICERFRMEVSDIMRRTTSSKADIEQACVRGIEDVELTITTAMQARSAFMDIVAGMQKGAAPLLVKDKIWSAKQ